MIQAETLALAKAKKLEALAVANAAKLEAQIPIIIEQHSLAIGAYRGMFEAGIAAGHALNIANEIVRENGKWLPWLKANVHISDRTAQQYMRAAKHEKELRRLVKKEDDAQEYAYLSLDNAMKAIATTKRTNNSSMKQADVKQQPSNGASLADPVGETMPPADQKDAAPTQPQVAEPQPAAFDQTIIPWLTAVASELQKLSKNPTPLTLTQDAMGVVAALQSIWYSSKELIDEIRPLTQTPRTIQIQEATVIATTMPPPVHDTGAAATHA